MAGRFRPGVRVAGVWLLIGLAALPSAARAATIHVAPTGADANDGQSWQSSKQTVGAGLAAAAPGDQVWVAAGTYAECITLKAGVALYGGFSGGETGLDQRDWAAHPAILDGNKVGSVVTAPSGATASTRIDGFTIRNGIGVLSGGARCGGGIYCLSASPTIANNTITGNLANGHGGGIFCSSASPAISNNLIQGNDTNNGYGGGIYCESSSAPSVSNNTITGNAAQEGGGVYCTSSSPPISNNVIAENIGGGIFCSNASPIILHNVIAANSGGDNGKGIACETQLSFYSSPRISNNWIKGNTGGGIGCFGQGTCSGLISSNVIAGNSGGITGGGISCSCPNQTISNNTIVENSARDGGGICILAGGSALISNNIVAFNSSGIWIGSTGSPTGHNNCVFNPDGYNYSASPGAGDISLDPRLVAVEYGAVHLNAGSPCIDTGYDVDVQAAEMDEDGEPRIQGAHVDIGADEFNGTTPPFAPSVVRVSPSGSDANDGSSWVSAKLTLQAGVDAASTTGGEVWVASGTYNERITLRPFAYLYGGCT